MRQLKELRNTGLLPEIEDKNRYIFGGLTGVVHEDRNSTGDWRKWTPTDERQNYIYFDDYGCTLHSNENDNEMQLGWMLENNLVRPEDLEWLKNPGYGLSYLDSNGKINFDDRALVVLSNNTPRRGNTMQAGWDAIRKFGLWPQGSTPFSGSMTSAEYYDKSDFPQWAYDIGLEFLKRFRVQYEGVSPNVPNLRKALKHAPLQIGIGLCPGYSSEGNVVNSCVVNPQHAITLVYIDEGGVYHIVDSYDPFVKRLAKTYKIHSAYKGVISPVVNVSGKKKENHVFEKNLSFGNYENEVGFLCNRLI